MGSKIKLSPVKKVGTASLKINKRNAKYFQAPDGGSIKNLKDDITRRGILVPLIAKKDGTLLAGHNRLIAAKQLKLKTVPVQYVDGKLSESREVEFIIKDNLLRRQLGPEERKQLYRRIYKDLDDRILMNNHSGCGVSIKKIAEETGINPKTINYDVSRMKYERKKELNLGKAIQTENEKAVTTYKKSVARMLNVAMVEQKITLDRFIEITKTATERLDTIKEMLNAKTEGVKCQKSKTLI
jgi:hypothetical protein